MPHRLSHDKRSTGCVEAEQVGVELHAGRARALPLAPVRGRRARGRAGVAGAPGRELDLKTAPQFREHLDDVEEDAMTLVVDFAT
jgi:hypothetical protein